MKTALQQIAGKLATAGTIIGCVYYFGLIALIAGTSPSSGNGPSAWDGYSPAIPGLPWFYHLAIATVILFGARMLRAWVEKKANGK